MTVIGDKGIKPVIVQNIMQVNVLTIGLSLPDSVCHTPQSRKHKEDRKLVRRWPPQQEGDDTGKVGHYS